MGHRLLLVLLIVPGILLSWAGISLIGNARAAHPVSASGTLARYDYHDEPLFGFITGPQYKGDAYDVTVTSADSVAVGPYRFHQHEFHPSGTTLGLMPDLSDRIGTGTTIWYDEGTGDLIALRVGDSIYSMGYFDHPRAKYWDIVARGLVLGSPGFLILAGVVIWAYRRTRSRVYSGTISGPAPARKMFADPHPYPREPITLTRAPSAIVAEFKQAVAQGGPLKARPDTALADKREEIIAALFDDVKKKGGVVSDAELIDLKKSIAELQTFVPADDAEVVAAYENAQRSDAPRSLGRANRERARAVLSRISAGQSAVANFRYSEPDHLRKGTNFMIVETLKWSDPAAAGESLKEGSGQAYGCLVYAAFGITAIVLVLAGQARWGSMQFWGLLVGTLAAVSLTIAASPLLDRLTRWLEDLDTLPSSMGYVLLVALLLVVPVASCLILVQVLNTVSSRF